MDALTEFNEMANIIFDLDGTVVDTSHRYRDTPEGHCDLDFWFANSTPEMIARDALLPLAASMRRFYERGHTIIICTARDFSPLNGVDLGKIYVDFLQANKLHYHALLHRKMAGSDHATLGDGDLKIRLLNDYARSVGLADMSALKAFMFDDNRKVIAAMLANGVDCRDAIELNARIAGRG